MNIPPFTKRAFLFVVLTGLCSAAGGCGSSNDFACTADIERGLEVSIFDAQTHAPIAQGAVCTIQDGNYIETLTQLGGDAAGNPVSLSGAFERPGTYTVSIGKTGYQTWVMKNVRVTKNACHVNLLRLEADLQPVN